MSPATLSRVLLIHLSLRLLEVHIELYVISVYLEYFLMFLFYRFHFRIVLTGIHWLVMYLLCTKYGLKLSPEFLLDPVLVNWWQEFLCWGQFSAWTSQADVINVDITTTPLRVSEHFTSTCSAYPAKQTIPYFSIIAVPRILNIVVFNINTTFKEACELPFLALKVHTWKISIIKVLISETISFVETNKKFCVI